MMLSPQTRLKAPGVRLGSELHARPQVGRDTATSQTLRLTQEVTYVFYRGAEPLVC
jgi:hypothetical protein